MFGKHKSGQEFYDNREKNRKKGATLFSIPRQKQTQKINILFNQKNKKKRNDECLEYMAYIVNRDFK